MALISMIASLKSPVEREESNHDLHLKSAGFQMQKMLSILLNWKNGIWTQHLLQQKMFITTKKNHCNNIEVIAIVYASVAIKFEEISLC